MIADCQQIVSPSSGPTIGGVKPSRVTSLQKNSHLRHYKCIDPSLYNRNLITGIIPAFQLSSVNPARVWLESLKKEANGVWEFAVTGLCFEVNSEGEMGKNRIYTVIKFILKIKHRHRQLFEYILNSHQTTNRPKYIDRISCSNIHRLYP